MGGTNPASMVEGLNTYIRPWEAYPATMSEGLTDSSLPLGGNLYLENTKLLLEVLKLHLSQWLCQHISYLFLCRNILELHCSPLHHILDIVILDLEMLRLIMEHWVL